MEKAREVGAAVLIVAQRAQWPGMRRDSENSAGAMLEAMQPLQEAAAEGLAVLMVRHAGKSAQEVGKSGRWSSAVSGVADLIVELSCPQATSAGQRRLRYRASDGFDTLVASISRPSW